MRFSKIFLYFILFFILISNVYSQYYADITIDVDKHGIVTIDGKSNYKELLNITNSQLYTSKNKNVWVFNLTINKNFDNFIYELNLPKYSQTNYIKTTPTFRIAEENNRIKLIGTGENQPLKILVQYTINKREEFVTENKNLIEIFSYVLVFIVLVGSIYFFIRIRRNVKAIIDVDKKKKEEKKDLNYSILPQRQQDIIKLLQERGKLIQKDLEDNMDIPKSSISRNVKTLVVKGIIKKERIGHTNYLSLR